MPLLRRASPPREALPGILPNRRQAQPALLRMLSRARRHRAPLLLLRIAPAAGGDAAAGDGHRRFLAELAAELRIGDLAWWEPGGVVLALLEDAAVAEGGAAAERAVVARLERRARRAGARPEWRAAGFPDQGLTLEALLEEVQWAER